MNVQATSTGNFKPYADMVRALFKMVDGDEGGLMHAAIGVSGEAGEIIVGDAVGDVDNVKEELGDSRFYLQVFFNRYGWELDSFLDTPTVRYVSGIEMLGMPTCMAVAAADLLDLIKKSWVYNKELDALKLYDAVNQVVYFYKLMLVKYNLQDQQVQEANQAKLAKRYPEGVYSDKAAQERADKLEAPLTALSA